MRRIIERKVTVVTTTTWTISWQDDPLQPSFGADPVQQAASTTDVLPAAQTTSSAIELKEADPEIVDQPAEPNPPSKHIHSYSSKPERK